MSTRVIRDRPPRRRCPPGHRHARGLRPPVWLSLNATSASGATQDAGPGGLSRDAHPLRQFTSERATGVGQGAWAATWTLRGPRAIGCADPSASPTMDRCLSRILLFYNKINKMIIQMRPGHPGTRAGRGRARAGAAINTACRARSAAEGRRRPESNRRTRICSPLRDHSATTPEGTWSGKRGSNSRPQPWQGCALPTELFPPAANRRL